MTWLCRASRAVLFVLLAVFGIACIADAQTILVRRRVALVIGNQTYRYVNSLSNPTADAILMARTLQEHNFIIVGGGPQIDLDKASFDQAMTSFENQMQGADIALFYYAGHGVEINGRNYLVPTDARPRTATDIQRQAVAADLVAAKMNLGGTRINLLVLDACRNNPFPQVVRSPGFREMNAPRGTVIAFSTQPGEIAFDAGSIVEHSRYTLSLVFSINLSGMGLQQTLNNTGLLVDNATGGKQVPWVSSTPMLGDFYFSGRGQGAEKNTTFLVFMDFLTADTTPRARQLIAEIAAAARALNAGAVEVNGYFDGNSEEQSPDLASRRAQSVAAELIRDGVPAQAIRARGIGSIGLVPYNPTMQRQPQNRRVEIMLR